MPEFPVFRHEFPGIGSKMPKIPNPGLISAPDLVFGERLEEFTADGN